MDTLNQFLRSQIESKDVLVIFNIQFTKCGIIQTGFRPVETIKSAEKSRALLSYLASFFYEEYRL